MQEAGVGSRSCKYMIRRKGGLAINFITFMKVASQDLF